MTPRRLFGLIVLIGAIAGCLVAVWARFVEPRRFRVVHVPVQLPRRHRHLAGLRIAFVADLHVGPHTRASAMTPVVEKLRAIEPDLVLFGGDYICESPRFMAEVTPVLGQMARTGKLGAYSVLGNHDIANFRERVQRPLEAEGISVLVNDARRVATDRGDLWIVGVDDVLLGRPDLARAFRDVPPHEAAICLWHEGDLAAKAAPYGAFLQLSGHSHGGQVRLPVVGPLASPKLGRTYVLGRYQIEDMELYVSAGLGMYRPPVRLNCPPELTIIQLID